PAGPGASLGLVTEGRFDVAGIAGTATGGNAVGTSALTAAFRQINGVAVGASGAVYVADPVNNQIRNVATGAAPATIVAGLPDGVAGYIGDNLPAVAVRLSNPVGLAFDAHTGALFVADAGNRRIREFVPGARIYTHAGGGLDAGDTVSPATDALLGRTTGVALDARGDVFFTERDTGRVRKVDAAGRLTTLATLTPGQVGPIAANAAGDRLWVGEGGAIRLLSPGSTPVLDLTPVASFAGATVTGLAADQAGTLYLARTTGNGAKETFVQRVLLAASGQPAAGRGPENVGGTGADVTASAAAFVDLPATDARTHLLANAGECSLGIDLTAANDPAVLSGILYAGNSYADPGTGPVWGQVLRLGPVGP
ncbi:MAG: hypothetical protein JWM80_2204, partial [Cyanobacteria bacterium RYN_339]|nr:hypothetical protein [Cyanobacteria bacterium RYN_339]